MTNAEAAADWLCKKKKERVGWSFLLLLRISLFVTTPNGEKRITEWSGVHYLLWLEPDSNRSSSRVRSYKGELFAPAIGRDTRLIEFPFRSRNSQQDCEALQQKIWLCRRTSRPRSKMMEGWALTANDEVVCLISITLIPEETRVVSTKNDDKGMNNFQLQCQHY